MPLTPEGFVALTQREILARIEADQTAALGPLLDLSPDQPLGQINGIFSRHIALAWEALQDIHDSANRERAEGDALDSLGALIGAERPGATFSRVLCSVTADIGTLLESGVHFAHLDGNPSVRFTPVENFAAPSTATHPNVPFRAEFTGPVAAGAGLLTVIATAVVGWNAITNPGDADPGENIATDEEYRLDQEEQLAATGSATVDAIRADVLAIEDEDGALVVQSCTVFENLTDAVDENGLPPHSIEVLIYDGDPPSADDDAIAQVIWDGRAGGIRPFGSESGTAEDDEGNDQIQAFSRVTAREIYVEYELETDDDYVGNSAFADAVAALANAAFTEAGADVIAARLNAFAFAQSGVTDVLSLTLGFAASPVGTANLPIGVRELARFDSSRITFA